MDDKFFLSIVIPAYNLENQIKRCLDSVFLAQKTVYPLEVIVVDDGSSDGTWEFLSKYKENLKSAYALKIFRREHAGVSVARNFGLSQAEGEYILFLDSDDYLVENALDGLLRFADDSKAEIVAYLMQTVRTDGSVIVDPMPEPAQGRGIEVLHSWLKRDRFTAGRDKMVSRRYLLDHDLFFMPNVIFEDVPWSAKLFAFDPQVAHSGLCVYTNERRHDSITRRKRSKNNLFSLRDILQNLDEFISEIPDARYVRDVKEIMCEPFFNMLSCLREVQGKLTPEERADFLAFLEKEKSIMKFSAKPNRRYLYRFIAEFFGVSTLMKIKK